MSSTDPNLENWKKFNGTEIGSYLSKIYGKKSNINYPTTSNSNTKQTTFQPNQPFKNSGKVEHTVKSRTNEKNLVPLPKRKVKEIKLIAAVDLIPRRKNETNITNELNNIKLQQQHYRPAYPKALSTDEEKDRLNQICRYKGKYFYQLLCTILYTVYIHIYLSATIHLYFLPCVHLPYMLLFPTVGGKALPPDFILPIQKAPYEIELENKYKHLNNNPLHPKTSTSSSSSSQQQQRRISPSPQEELCDQITLEINERIAHLQEMKASGLISNYEISTIEGEIRQRTIELR